MNGFKAEEVDMNTALCDLKKYDYGLIFYISGKVLEKTENITFQPEECLEARFFSEDSELHIFDCNGEKKAVVVKDVEGEHIDKKYVLAKAYSTLGNTVTVRQYPDYDSDGQVYIAATRLVSIEKE